MSETRPKDFRRDSGIPCPCCSARLHSFEMLGIHYANHTPEEKEAAWANVPAFFASKCQVFGLVRMGEVSRAARLQAEGCGYVTPEELARRQMEGI